jgi:hypothetical protein
MAINTKYIPIGVQLHIKTSFEGHHWEDEKIQNKDYVSGKHAVHENNSSSISKQTVSCT